MGDESGLVLRWTTVVVVAFVLQVGLVADVRPFGVHGDVMLLLAVCAGLAGGPGRGAVVGFVAGLLVDLLMPGTLGVAAMAYAVVGFVVGTVQEAMLNTSRAFSIVVTAIASALGILLFALLGELLGQRSLTDPQLLPIVGIVAAFNALLCVPTLAVSRWAEGSATRLGAR